MTRRMGWLSAIVFSLMAAVACSETDAGVTTKVKAKLAADDAVKAYQIDVDTRDKVVTLSGNVENDIAKTQASRLARETEGVARVVDNVTVARQPVDTPNMADRTDLTDPAITAAVKAKLLGDPDVAGLKLDVDTQSGVVTLSGTVKTVAEKEEAISIARDTAGVKSVNDMIKIGA